MRWRNAIAGVGAGFGGSSWAPSSLPGLAVWSDPSSSGTVTMAPDVTGTDWDMENAGTAEWRDIYGKATVITKETGSLGSSGSQRLSGELASGDTYYGVAPVTFGITAGIRYRVRALCDRQTVSTVRFYVSGPSYVWSDSTHTGTQTMGAEFTTGAGSWWFNVTGTAGDYADYDDVSFVPLSVLAVADMRGGGSFAQSTAANVPWKSDGSGVVTGTAVTDVDSLIGSREGLRFDGTEDYAEHASPALTSTWTLAMTIQPKNVTADQAILGLDTSTARIGLDSSGHVVVTDGTTTITGSTALTAGTDHQVIVTSDGTTTTIYIDGSSDGSGSLAITLNNVLTLGATGDHSTAFYDGKTGEVVLYSRVLPASQISTLQTYLAQRWT